MRFERKYPVTGTTLAAIESLIKMHPLGFRRIFPDRSVNSLYFDTPGFDLLLESLAGAAERLKFRIRWYSENINQVIKPVLEVKLRRFDLGDKLNFLIPEKETNLGLIVSRGPQWIRELFSQEWEVIPTVYVSYTRSYWGSEDHKFRVTIDRNLTFRNSDFHLFPGFSPQKAGGHIVELKYESGDDEDLKNFAPGFPLRAGKSSKYVKGMMLLEAN